MALPPEARAPKKRKVRKKPYSPPPNFHTDVQTDRRPKPKAGPPSPQRTGKPKTPQPGVRKKKAAPTTTDRSSDSSRSSAQKARDRKAVAHNVAEARRKVVRKRGRGAIVRQAKKELEGRGAVAGALGKLGEDIDKKGILVSTGGGPGVGVPKRKSSGIATALAPKGIKVKGSIAGRALKDLANLPAQALPSVYVPVAGAVEAAQGRPDRLKKLAHDIDKHDPVYNLGAAAVHAIKGEGKEAKERLDRASKSANEHPGFAAAEVYGVKGTVGRAGGSVARKGVVGKRAKKAASTEREARQVPGTNIREERSYSRDVTQKATQVVVEKVKRKSAKRLREKAKRVPEDEAEVLRERASRRDPDRLPEKEINRRVDERLAVNEDVRRGHRGETIKRAREIVKPVKREGHVTSVVTQRITKADKSDLKAYVRELEAEFSSLGNAKKRANKTLRRKLQSVIDDPKADLARVETAAREFAEFQAPVRKKLVKRGILDEEQANRATVIPYAVRRMDAEQVVDWVEGQKFPNRKIMQRDPKGHAEWTRMKQEVERAREDYHAAKGEPDGNVETALERLNDAKEKAAAAKVGAHRELSTDQIKQHMAAHGEKEPAFITQRPNARGARNFNVRSERAPGPETMHRSGEATRKGTFDADPEALVEGAARAQGLVDATSGFRKTIKEFSARGPDGKVIREKSYTKILERAQDLMHDSNGDPIPGAMKFRPVRLEPFGSTKEHLESLLEDVNSLDQDQASTLIDAMKDGIAGKGGGGPWALIPETAAKRIQEHLDQQGGGAGKKGLQLANQTFRRTVLATSPSWMAGNVIEGLMRAGITRSGPKSYARGRGALKELKEIDPKAAEEAMSRIVGGGHFSSADRSHVRRGAEQFENTNLAPIATALGRLWRTPGPKHAADFWHRYTDFVFNQVNGRVESAIQTAMLGRALKDSGMKAVDEAAHGLRHTSTQVRFGREVDKMFGRYGKRTPAEKYWFTTFTPFAAWALNAARFVYITLPKDHPVSLSVIAAAENATQEWRKQKGMDLFIEGALPGFLQGSIPTKGGGHQRISRYTPFGAFGSPSETVAGQVLPLWSGVLAALKGKDWKGRDLQVDDNGSSREANEIERFVFAGRAFLEATIPAYSVGKRVVEQGPKDALNPFKAVKPKKIRQSSSSGTAGRIVGAGSGAGKIVGSGSGGGKIVTP